MPSTTSSTGGWGTTIGATTSLLSGILNRQQAPNGVRFDPNYQPVDLQAEQRNAITGNLSAEPTIEELLSRADRYTQGQARSLMEMAMPGFGKLQERFMTLAGDNLKNPYALPPGVSENLTRIAAERGINTGVHGQAQDYSLLRDFGVNMLQYGDSRVNQAQSLLTTIGNLSPRVSPMSPLSFYVTPMQQASNADNTQQTLLNIAKVNNGIDNASANAAAAASNWNRQNMWDSIASGLSMFGSYMDNRG